MKRLSWVLAGLSLFGLLLAGPFAVGQNFGPPVGGLGVTGFALDTGSYGTYLGVFTASSSLSTLTFAIRNDPGWTALDDVHVYLNGVGPDLANNGGFESAINGATDWTQTNVFGATFAGFQTNSGCNGIAANTGTGVWCDGSTSAYDAITEQIATVAGGNYWVYFSIQQVQVVGGIVDPATNYQALCTNGANGTTSCNANDVFVYFQDGLPAPSPEPASLLLLGSGLIGIAGKARSKLRG